MGVGPITPVITIVGDYLGGVKFQSIAKTGSMPKQCHSWVSSSLHRTHLCNHHIVHSCKTLAYLDSIPPGSPKKKVEDLASNFNRWYNNLLAIFWIEPVLPQNGAFFHQQTPPLTDDRFPNNISQPPPCWPQIQRMSFATCRLVNHPYIWTFDHDDVIWDHQV